MWNYIYLSIYLDQIDISDYNAIQKFIYDMVSKHKHDYANIFTCLEIYLMIDFQITREKHDFFPLFQALELEKEEDKTEKQLDALKNMVEKILKKFEEQVKDLLSYCISSSN